MRDVRGAGSEGLIRSLRRWDVVAVTINGVIGAGIFGLPSKAYALAGDYSILAFFVCALFVSTIVLCFAEVASRFSETGGPYLYCREAFGPVVGFEVGWLQWVARVTAFAANCNLMIEYAAWFAPGLATGFARVALIASVALPLAGINLVGIRDTAVANAMFAICKLLPLVGVVAFGIFAADPSRLSLAHPPPWSSFSTTALLLAYAFTGFEMAVIPGGETREPRRTIPFAIITAMAFIALLYVMIHAVCMAVVPNLAHSSRPVADAAQALFGPAGASIAAAGVIVSVAGNLNIVLLSASRLLFAIGERGEAPELFAAVNSRFGTPHWALIVTAACMLGLSLSGTFIYALTVSTIARLLTYWLSCASLPVFRRRSDVPAALFRVPGGSWIALFAIALASWLLFSATWREMRDTAIAGAAGLALYLFARWQRAAGTSNLPRG
jgi:amino acid transporter